VDAMEKVIEGGTGTIAKIPGVSMCGKTGTAENPHGEDHSIFIAFAPKDNPKIAIATYVENAGFGATWAAPISSLLIEKYLHDSISRPALEKRMLEGSLLHKYPGYVNPNPPATKPGENGEKPKPTPTDTLKPQAVWPVNRKTLSSTSIAQR
jgi:penicillin-binding protein 2